MLEWLPNLIVLIIINWILLLECSICEREHWTQKKGMTIGFDASDYYIKKISKFL